MIIYHALQIKNWSDQWFRVMEVESWTILNHFQPLETISPPHFTDVHNGHRTSFTWYWEVSPLVQSKKQKNGHVLVLTYVWNSIVWNEILLIMAISSKFIWSFLLNLFLSEDVVQALDHSSVVVPLATHKRRCYVHTGCYYQHIEVSYIDGLNTCTWWAQRKPIYL